MHAVLSCPWLVQPLWVQGLLVNFDCSAMWFQDSYWIRRALSLTPEYLKAAGNEYDLRDLQVGCLMFIMHRHVFIMFISSVCPFCPGVVDGT